MTRGAADGPDLKPPAKFASAPRKTSGPQARTTRQLASMRRPYAIEPWSGLAPAATRDCSRIAADSHPFAGQKQWGAAERVDGEPSAHFDGAYVLDHGRKRELI